MNLAVSRIKDYVGYLNYVKGNDYYKDYIHYNSYYKVRGELHHLFRVLSEYSDNYYDVEICVKNNDIASSNCECPQFKRHGTCKHVAACLIHYQKELNLFVDEEQTSLLVSKEILNKFYKPVNNNQIHLKKQLSLEIEIQFINNYYENCVIFNFKVGEDKMYNLNSKLKKFLEAYINEEELVFGKNFTYNPDKHYFSKNDQNIIDYLVNLYEKNPYYQFQYFRLKISDFIYFLELLKNKTFFIIKYGTINNILEENPFKLSLMKDDKYYKLKIYDNGTTVLDNEYNYVVKDSTLYKIPEKIKEIVVAIKNYGLDELIFKDDDIDAFSNGILPIIKNNIELDDNVQDKFIIGLKPNIKIYLDLKKGLILCNLKLEYSSEEIDYFDKNPKIVRDNETENEVIEDLLSYGFISDNQKIYMEDIDLIGEFLENSIIELAKKYEIFTSDKIKETKIIKNNSISSSFSIGEDNIMKYEFDLGNIKNEEIVDIFEKLKTKQRYYRLKSGDLIDLNDNAELKELESLVDDMEISKKDLKSGYGVIPKYRAIYLDSVKKDKYKIIKTNNLFDDLINRFTSYKNIDIVLNSKDKKLLRDYQIIGVKWLYNIYKCGFGGILADEMGLGKSIQLIYLIKQIMKEKKDAKILIVAPTSLIYNWKNEFDKFGSELRYKVFAENKIQRKHDLDNLDNVDILITTYGLIRQDKEKYLEMNFELIAIDEAQNIKNVNAQMTKVIKMLKANTKIALTGTPLENSVIELWSIFDFIMPGYLANYLSFSRKYNIKDVDDNDLKSLDNLNKQIQPFILRRRKKDVVKELPDKIENIIYIDLNKEQKKLYVAQLEKTKKEMEEIVASDGFEKGSFKILQLLTKLRQLCIDPNILYDNYNGGSSKIENLVDIVKGIIQNGHKILLFTSFKTALDIVNKEFTNNGISTYIIDGSVSSKKRMELVDKFNSDDTNVFLITLKAGGTGLNLTSADVVIHLDLWWNPQVENQATDRAHRIGQKNTVEVIKLVCKGTIEERILELQIKKKILSDKVIEGDDKNQNIISKLTEKDIKNLLSLDNEDDD